jgi:hypothetical protein
MTGAPDDVRPYCKKRMDYVGRKDGFIMDSSACVTAAKEENLRAMFEFEKEYVEY